MPDAVKTECHAKYIVPAQTNQPLRDYGDRVYRTVLRAAEEQNFVGFIAQSGTGKSQIAHTIPGGIRLVLLTGCNQPINHFANHLAGVFTAAVRRLFSLSGLSQFVSHCTPRSSTLPRIAP